MNKNSFFVGVNHKLSLQELTVFLEDSEFVSVLNIKQAQNEWIRKTINHGDLEFEEEIISQTSSNFILYKSAIDTRNPSSCYTSDKGETLFFFNNNLSVESQVAISRDIYVYTEQGDTQSFYQRLESVKTSVLYSDGSSIYFKRGSNETLTFAENSTGAIIVNSFEMQEVIRVYSSQTLDNRVSKLSINQYERLVSF